jgi:isorenieratene synthase
MPDAVEIRKSLLNEFQTYFPELRGCELKYEYFQLKNDFTAFHTNLFNTRSAYYTPLPTLFLAGDWVKIPTPAMLMEAATTSALFAVNEILKKESLQQEAVYTVPLRGLLA